MAYLGIQPFGMLQYDGVAPVLFRVDLADEVIIHSVHDLFYGSFIGRQNRLL